MKKLLLLLLLLPGAASAQQYIRVTTDLNDPDNSKLLQDTELLGVVKDLQGLIELKVREVEV